MRAIANGAADTAPFVDKTPGPATFMAPKTGVYDIIAFGAEGGDSGGSGAEIGGSSFSSRASGQVLQPIEQNISVRLCLLARDASA